jgi:hypothetical protein
VRADDRGGHRDVVDGGAERAGDVDAGPFGVGRGPAWAPGQPGGPAQLANQRFALPMSLFCGDGVSGPVGSGELIIQFPDPVPIGVAGGGIQQWPAICECEPRAAGYQVERRDFAARGGQQGAQVVQAAALAQPGLLCSGLQEPVLAIAAQARLAGCGGEPAEQPRYPEPLGDLAGPGRRRSPRSGSRPAGRCRARRPADPPLPPPGSAGLRRRTVRARWPAWRVGRSPSPRPAGPRPQRRRGGTRPGPIRPQLPGPAP